MKFDVFVFKPQPGHIVEIYSRCYGHDFLTGYCRSLFLSPMHVHFMEGFQRALNANLTHSRLVPSDWECVLIEKASVGFAREQPWMRVLRSFKGT